MAHRRVVQILAQDRQVVADLPQRDEPEAVRNRLHNYHVQTAPVIAWYRANGARLRTIDAVGTLDEVLSRVRKALDS